MGGFKLRARAFTALALAALAFAPACYSTTPHRAEVASSAAPKQCADAVAEVFARSGFVQLPTPPKLSMLFGARGAGPYTSFLATGSAVGVTFSNRDGAGETCHVTLEALSPDAGCAGTRPGDNGSLSCRRMNDPAAPVGGLVGSAINPPCPVIPVSICELSYAPGADNDAAVDELARRVQTALGERGVVN